MSRFTWIPDYSAAVDESPRIQKSTLGDGYTQRAIDGINADMKVWTLKFFRTYTEIIAIRAFLKAHGGVTNFDWLDPDDEDLKYVCAKYGRTFDAFGGGTLTATFEQVPEQ